MKELGFDSIGIKFEFNEERLEELYSQERLLQYDDSSRSGVYWDMEEICHQTGLNQLQIKQNFFMDERFKKFKVGRKWLFPADENKAFIEVWLKEQTKGGAV